jgi:hypothetical protein
MYITWFRCLLPDRLCIGICLYGHLLMYWHRYFLVFIDFYCFWCITTVSWTNLKFEIYSSSSRYMYIICKFWNQDAMVFCTDLSRWAGTVSTIGFIYWYPLVDVQETFNRLNLSWDTDWPLTYIHAGTYYSISVFTHRWVIKPWSH